MRKVYTIKGSEDGVIGVCSNKKAAFNKAYAYIINGGESEVFDYYASDFYADKGVLATYPRIAKQLNKGHAILCNSYGSVEVEIEMFYLESK